MSLKAKTRSFSNTFLLGRVPSIILQKMHSFPLFDISHSLLSCSRTYHPLLGLPIRRPRANIKTVSWLDKLKNELERTPPSDAIEGPSAVVVLILKMPDEPVLVLTKRTQLVRTHR